MKNNHNFMTMNQVHSVNKRNAKNFVVTRCNTELAKSNFYYKSPLLFNGLPDEIMSINSLSVLKKRLKEYFYNKGLWYI